MNKFSNKNNKQAGFTLIELIVVIVILGILAATALPKFASLGGDARLASMQAAKGALSSTIAMAKGKYLVNSTGVPLTSLTLEGTTVNYTTLNDGHLVASKELATMAGLNETDYVISTSGTGTGTGLTISPLSLKGTANETKCFVRYLPPTVKDQPAVLTVTGTAADCQ